jgi:hypothetical protein
MSPQPGQGTPLPAFLRCEGDWIVENYLYLYFDGQTDAGPRLAVGASRHDGKPCHGLSASQLAGALGVDADTVIRANRDHRLICLGVADTPPMRGGTGALTYAFQLGEKRGSLTVETGHQEGAA